VPSFNDGAVAFIGAGALEPAAIYTNAGGSLVRVIGVGDVLGGHTIKNFSLSRESLSGENLAFTATFTDGSQAVYLAELAPVPEPASWVLAVIGLAGVAAARRWRSK
jgi:hypothetical protein